MLTAPDAGDATCTLLITGPVASPALLCENPNAGDDMNEYADDSSDVRSTDAYCDG